MPASLNSHSPSSSAIFQPPEDPVEIERAIDKLNQVYALFDDELNADDEDHLFQLAALDDPNGQPQRVPALCAVDEGDEDDDEVFLLAALDDPSRPASPKQSPQQGTVGGTPRPTSVADSLPAPAPPTANVNKRSNERAYSAHSEHQFSARCTIGTSHNGIPAASANQRDCPDQ